MDILRANLTPDALVAHNKDSYNALIENGLMQIISESYRVESTFTYEPDIVFQNNQSVHKISISAKFSNVKISPKKPEKNKAYTPYIMRQLGQSYSADVTTTVNVTTVFYNKDGDVITEKFNTADSFLLGSIPIMVKSTGCSLYKRDQTDLEMVEWEDPNDPGGYFIIKGNEWTIDTTENITFNIPHIYNNNHGSELTRLEFISKAGDAFENSKQLIMSINNNKSITVNLASNLDFKKTNIDFPVRLIFMLLGAKNDKEIFDLVNPDKDAGVQRILMNNYLHEPKGNNNPFVALNYVYDADKIAYILGKNFLKVASKNLVHNAAENIRIDKETDIIQKLYSTIDSSLFTHIGVSETDRRTKCIFLSTLVRKMILIHLNRLPESNRDSYISKRLHSAGLSMSKGFKQTFKTVTVNSLRKIFYKVYNSHLSRNKDDTTNNISSTINSTFGSNPDTFNVDIIEAIRDYKPDTLTDAIEKSMTASEAFKKKHGKNHLSTQNLNRKNFLNTLSVMRNIHTNNTNAGAKSKRATEMRAVQPSYTGYVCPIASADTGEKVGLSKQLAITAKITISFPSFVVKKYIKDKLKINIDNIIEELNNNTFDYSKLTNTKVHVNGDLVGYTDDAYALATSLRNERRDPGSELLKYAPKEITVHLDIFNQSLNIWVDLGRVVRPLLIVYRDPKTKKQYTKYNPTEHNGMTFDQLCDLGVMEYISCEESENCYIAYNIDQLIEHENSTVYDYTHVEIEQAILGITALTSPFLNHTMATRCTYQTNQAKQACGIYCLNPHRRYDRKKALQNYCEQPLVPTLINDIIYPNGQNLVVAMMCHTGYNQEDSTIINKSTADKGYLGITNYTYESISVMSNTEVIRNYLYKDGMIAETIQKITADRSFLDESGIIKKGSVIGPNTVLVSKLKSVPSADDKSMNSSIDQSLIYNGYETVEVDDVMVFSLSNIPYSVKIRLKSIRKIVPGDKLSTRSGNKNIVSVLLPESEMPYIASTGVIPDMIVNPHSVPTRMVIGQLIEAIYAKLALQTCKPIDGTVFTKVNVDEIRKQLREYGINEFGLEKMVCGVTGKMIESLIFVCPTYIQRLQKFAVDEIYVSTKGPIDEVTHQPREGRSANGGLRLGEMEKDVLSGNGISNCFREKLLHGPDRTIEYVCRRCGFTNCIYNKQENLYMCLDCNTPNGDIYAVNSNYINVIFKDVLRALGVDMRYQLDV